MCKQKFRLRYPKNCDSHSHTECSAEMTQPTIIKEKKNDSRSIQMGLSMSSIAEDITQKKRRAELKPTRQCFNLQ